MTEKEKAIQKLNEARKRVKVYPPIKREKLDGIVNDKKTMTDKQVDELFDRMQKFASDNTEKWKQEELEEQERIEEQKKYEEKLRLKKHKEGGGKIFEDFKAENQMQKDALKAIKNFPKSDNKFMIITGSVGTGKTHLASALSFEKRFVMINAVQLLPLLREYNYPGLEHNYNALPDYDLNEILEKNFIIDDLGSELMDNKGTTIECLKIMIDRCQKKMIITTNLKLADLINRYEEKNLSRFLEKCKPVEMIGDDYRLRDYGVKNIEELKNRSYND